MQKLIEQLFQWQGLKQKSDHELELYGHGEPDKTSYWLVIHGKPDISPERQAKWLADCKRATADPALEKNINLLIVWKTDILNERTSKLVNYTEEDSYFFKKHVLPYTEVELEALLQQVEKKGLESVFSNILTDTETFTSYKNQYHKGGWQNLLYRLAIKISALTIQNSTRASLASLEENIRERIRSSPDGKVLVATDLALLSLANKNSFEEAQPRELFELMSKQLKEAGHGLDS
ncbi:ABC-three component system middle component 1 [Oceanisphaera ostreae]|uniref:ABC-three component system middle component 1 n=1 Tax=Oceanisphaera ostreae TaxID=914151 RepID=A0ABW3KMJ7_9GAMM